MSDTLRPGATVDRYRIELPIGEGGMATVYRVRHSLLGTVHALKVLHVDSPAFESGCSPKAAPERASPTTTWWPSPTCWRWATGRPC